MDSYIERMYSFYKNRKVCAPVRACRTATQCTKSAPQNRRNSKLTTGRLRPYNELIKAQTVQVHISVPPAVQQEVTL